MPDFYFHGLTEGNMNKQDLISQASELSDVPHATTEVILNNILDVIAGALAKRDKVTLIGFGTFEAKFQAGRKGINPQTREPIDIPPKTVPKFKAGKDLKARVAQKDDE